MQHECLQRRGLSLINKTLFTISYIGNIILHFILWMEWLACIMEMHPLLIEKIKFVLIFPQTKKSLWFLKNRSSELMKF